jgi:hypothetical protein
MFNFVVDRIVKGHAYPGLAQHSAEPYTTAWREFGSHSPYTVPAELINHCETHAYPYRLIPAADIELAAGADLWYPVQFARFDFAIDYISLLSTTVKEAIVREQIRILFYYHEGDDPQKIKARLDLLCKQNSLDIDCYRFVSGNTAADSIRNSIYFSDHELLYWHRNQMVNNLLFTGVPMRANFLIMNRTHKAWRSVVMADLARTGVLEQAVYSYNCDLSEGTSLDDCAIQADTLGLLPHIETFLAGVPYCCDTLTSDQHNDHSLTTDLFDRTWCSIVLETHFDADGSGGAFLTEKTFKCLKHGHPFVLVGCAGSLAALRSAGYRTFDQVIDPAYDTIQDNTQRWLAVRALILDLDSKDMSSVYAQCAEDILHNRQHFLASKHNRLNSLYERLHNE